MTVGIVVPTLNRIRKTTRFAYCLSRQTFKDFHLYIVDSGSTDGTQEAIFTFPIPCTLIRASLDDWWSANTNLGIKKALEDGCDLILTINDDSIILEDYLEKFVELFRRHDLKICANRIDFADNPGKVWALGSYSTFGSPFLFQLKYNSYWFNELPSDIRSNEIVPTMTVCGDGVLIHRNVFEQIGFFNETFTPQVHGDSEFSFRAQKHGIPLYIATSIVLYNDVYNLSEEKKQFRNRTFLQKIKDVFFNKKSDCYWRPVFYITAKYASYNFLLPTLLRFFIWKFYVLFFSDFSKYIEPEFSNTFRGKIINKIKHHIRNLLVRIAIWVLDIDKYDFTTKEHILIDEKQRKLLEDIKLMVSRF